MKIDLYALQLRHYEAIKKRGLINNKTKPEDFLEKLNEEFEELLYEDQEDLFIQEAIDCISVLNNMLIHMKVDIKEELLKNILVQEKRSENG